MIDPEALIFPGAPFRSTAETWNTDPDYFFMAARNLLICAH